MKKKSFTTILFFIIFFWFSLQPAIDPDTGWHIATGRFIWQEKKIPLTDPFSYSLPDHKYIAHSWGFDLLAYAIEKNLGVIGLSVLYALITACTLLVLSRISFHQGQKIPLAVWAIIAPVAIEIIGQRPQAVTALGLALTLLFLETKTKPHHVWSMLLIYLVWANMHGGVILGIGLMVLYALLRFIKEKKPDDKHKIILWCTAISLINPYTFEIYTFALGMVTNQTALIYNSDWVPLLSSRLPENTVALRIAILVMSIIGIIDNKQKFPASFVAGIFLIASLKSLRFLLPLLIVVSPLVVHTFNRVVGDQSRRKWLSALIVCLISGLFFTQLVVKKDLWCTKESVCYAREADMPHRAIEFIKRNNISGNFFNFYTWGGYLIWQLPESKFFIDGRMDNFFIQNQSFLQEFVRVDQLEEGWYEKLLFSGTSHAIFPQKWQSHKQALEGFGWKTLYEDEEAIIMAK